MTATHKFPPLLAGGEVEVEGGHVVKHAVQRLLRVLFRLPDL